MIPTIMEDKKTVSTVMLIDDNRIDNILNRKVLEKEAFAENILVYDNAQEALDYLRNVENQPSVDVQVPAFIFIDVVMPHMNGFQFIREFDKLSPWLKSSTQIIFISSALLTAPQQIELSQFNIPVSVVGKPLNKSILEKLR